MKQNISLKILLSRILLLASFAGVAFLLVQSSISLPALSQSNPNTLLAGVVGSELEKTQCTTSSLDRDYQAALEEASMQDDVFFIGCGGFF